MKYLYIVAVEGRVVSIKASSSPDSDIADLHRTYRMKFDRTDLWRTAAAANAHDVVRMAKQMLEHKRVCEGWFNATPIEAAAATKQAASALGVRLCP